MCENFVHRRTFKILEFALTVGNKNLLLRLALKGDRQRSKVEVAAKNILHIGAWDVAVGKTFYCGVFNLMRKLKLKNKPKMTGFFIFIKQAIEIHGTKISGKIIVK